MHFLQDIQIRGVNRDEKNIQMAKQFPNSRHFLTYKHSLRVINAAYDVCYKLLWLLQILLVELGNITLASKFNRDVVFKPSIPQLFRDLNCV